VVAEALKDATDDMSLLRSCLLEVEGLVIGKYQRFPFPRGKWLSAVRSADTTAKLLDAIRGFVWVGCDDVVNNSGALISHPVCCFLFFFFVAFFFLFFFFFVLCWGGRSYQVRDSAAGSRV